MQNGRLALSFVLLIVVVIVAAFGISRRTKADDEMVIEGPPKCDCTQYTEETHKVKYRGIVRALLDENGDVIYYYCNLENCV